MVHTLMTLANGIEIYGEYVSATDTSITLFKPMVVISKYDAAEPYFQMTQFSNYAHMHSFSKKFIIALTNENVPQLEAVWMKILEIQQKRAEAAEFLAAQEAEFESTSDIVSDDGDDSPFEDNVIAFDRLKPTLH